VATGGSGIRAARDWWGAATTSVGDTDIIVGTEKGALIRLDTRTIRAAATPVNLVDPTDRIVCAFFCDADEIALIADDNKLLTLPRRLLPYKTPTHPARIAQLAKSRTPFTKIVPIRPVANASELVLVGAEGAVRRTLLKNIPTTRAALAFPEAIRYASFGTGPVELVVGTKRVILKPKEARLGTLKRTNALGKAKAFGPFFSAERGNYLVVGEDALSVSKQAVLEVV
jgi:hypothetical protein